MIHYLSKKKKPIYTEGNGSFKPKTVGYKRSIYFDTKISSIKPLLGNRDTVHKVTLRGGLKCKAKVNLFIYIIIILVFI